VRDTSSALNTVQGILG